MMLIRTAATSHYIYMQYEYYGATFIIQQRDMTDSLLSIVLHFSSIKQFDQRCNCQNNDVILCCVGVAYLRSVVTRYTFGLYSDVIMSAMASHIIDVSIVYSTVCSGVDQRKYQSFASLAFVRGIHRWSVNFPHKGPVTRKFDVVIMRLHK